MTNESVFDRVKSVQSTYIRNYLEQEFPGGKWENNHRYRMGDLYGEPGESFCFDLNIMNGVDFAGGFNGDIIEMIAQKNSMQPLDAAKKIANDWGVSIQKEKPRFTPVHPVPSQVELSISTFTIDKLGEIAGKWKYLNKEGGLLGYVVRFSNNKDYHTYQYCTDKKWHAQGFEKPRPLYNMQNWKRDTQIVVVEGEKAADAATKLCPWGIVVTWPGGSNAVKMADWKAIGRAPVIIWRDADEAGLRAETELCKILKAQGCKVKTLGAEFYAGKPKGWDAADALDEGYTDVVELFKAHAVEYTESQFASSGQLTSQVADTKTSPSEPLNKYFRTLGMVGTAFAFYNYTAGIVNIEKNSGLTKKFFLSLTNGDMDYWMNSFGYDDKDGGRKIVWDAVSGSLMGQCNNLGQFDLDALRGVGAWQDKRHIVVNAGKFLYVDGKKTSIDKFDSAFLYQKSSEIFSSIENPLSAADRKKFVDLCSMFSWEHPVSGKLLAGWLMIAPICGCLDWRPHLYICGMAGTGKSTIYKQILSRTLGDFKRAYLGSTTEAGVRQRGSNDSLPAIFDEFEIDSRESAKRIEAILTLFRMCSDAHDGRLYKGSQDQSKAVSYTVQSAACFSSITPSIKHFADITRITTLTLKTEHNKEQERRANFKNVERIIAELMGDVKQSNDFAESFAAYSILNAHNIIASWRSFKEAAAINNDFSARIADQVGMLMAGWWMYENDRPITVDEAVKVLSDVNWQDLVPNKGQQNQSRLLRTLAQHIYDVDNEDRERPRKYGRNIGRLVEYLNSDRTSGDPHKDIGYFSAHVVENFLLGKGIIIEDGYIYFSNSSDELRRVLYNTQWEADWKTTLKAIVGAVVPELPKYFGPGIGMSRCVGVPVALFLDNSPNESPASD